MRCCAAAAVAAAAVVLALAARLVINANVLTTLVPQGNERCVRVRGFSGCEDGVVLDRLGVVLVGSDAFDFMAGKQSSPREALKTAPAGHLFALSIDTLSALSGDLQLSPATHALRLDGYPAGAKLNPHGVGAYDQGEGRPYLVYVVNHRSDGDVIEVFEYEGGEAVRHVKSIRHPLLTWGNDVHPVGADAFYVTIYAVNEPGTLLNTLENLAQLPIHSVLFCDASGPQPDCRRAVSGLAMANGITGSPDGREIAVVLTLGSRIAFYARDPTTNTLTERDSLPVPSACDNIHPTGEANTYTTACHPKALRFLAHSEDHSKHSPSQVLQVRSSPSKSQGGPPPQRLTQLFQSADQAPDLAASSFALRAGSVMVIGAVFDDGLQVCPAA